MESLEPSISINSWIEMVGILRHIHLQMCLEIIMQITAPGLLCNRFEKLIDELLNINQLIYYELSLFINFQNWNMISQVLSNCCCLYSFKVKTTVIKPRLVSRQITNQKQFLKRQINRQCGSVKDLGNIISIVLWRQLERTRSFTQARVTGQDGRK